MFYLLPFLFGALIPLGATLGGLWNYLMFVCVFLLFPLLDVIAGTNPVNFSEATEKMRESNFWYTLLLYALVPVQLFLIFYGAHEIGSLDIISAIGLILSVGTFTGGLGITTAHELGHRHGKLPIFLSKVLLWTVGYTHFYIEHNRGHHTYVATDKDPASARKGQSVYGFWIQSVIGSYASAWKIELNRLTREGFAKYGYKNRMIRYAASIVALNAAMYFLFGWKGLVFQISQSVVGFTLLEIVNYLEHYGLSRKEIHPGKIEKVEPHHSWNSDHRLSNYLLFGLPRHSDHHANAKRPYQVLRHFDNTPQLPLGYPAMVIVALFPPLWKWIMHPRLDALERSAANQLAG